jgi:glycosyltransferase involved in cell wall biosynthesis
MNNKVFIFTDSLGIGGTERHLSKLIPKIKSLNFDITLVLLKSKGALFKELKQKGAPVIAPWIELKPKSNLFQKFIWLILISTQIFVILIFNRPRIVHFFLPTSYLIAGTVSFMLGIKIRLMSRRSLNNYQYEKLFLLRIYERILHSTVNEVLGNSKMVCAQLEQEGVPKAKVRLLYNGYEPSNVKPFNACKLLGIKAGTKIIINVANLIPYKGHREILDAMSKVKTKQNWVLLLLGEGDDAYKSELKLRAENLGVDKNIYFLGQVNNIEAYLKAGSLGIVASHEEGFSNVIIESMAMGLPLIVTDVGGNLDAITHGKSGLVVKPKDPDSLALAVERLLNEEKLGPKLAANAKSNFLSKFSMNNCLEAYHKMYSNYLG